MLGHFDNSDLSEVSQTSSTWRHYSVADGWRVGCGTLFSLAPERGTGLCHHHSPSWLVTSGKWAVNKNLVVLKWIVKKTKRGGVPRMLAARPCPSLLPPHHIPAGHVMSIGGCWAPGEWIITYQPCKLTIIHNPGLTQHRLVQAICWDHQALAFRSGLIWPQLARNHINILKQALQMDRLRISRLTCLVPPESGTSITVTTCM